MHWVGWHKMTRSKKNGGMGFREMQVFNQSMLAKTAWKIVKDPEAWWVRILRSIYFPTGNFMAVRETSMASWVWKSILWGREALQKGLRWNIRNGRQVMIWNVPWVPNLPNF